MNTINQPAVTDPRHFIAPAFDDDTSMPVIARVGATGDSIFVEQGCDPENMWAGAKVIFSIANAEKVIDAIRAAVAASKTKAVI